MLSWHSSSSSSSSSSLAFWERKTNVKKKKKKKKKWRGEKEKERLKKMLEINTCHVTSIWEGLSLPSRFSPLFLSLSLARKRALTAHTHTHTQPNKQQPWHTVAILASHLWPYKHFLLLLLLLLRLCVPSAFLPGPWHLDSNRSVKNLNQRSLSLLRGPPAYPLF